MNKKIMSGVILLSFFTINSAVANENFQYSVPQAQFATMPNNFSQSQYPQNNMLQGSVVMVPAGATLKASLTTQLSSASTSAGQTVSIALGRDFYYDGKLIAPAGSTIYGTVIEASKAKHGSINGKICVRFTQIYTPYGTQIPISAVIKTTDNTGVLVGGTALDVTKEYAKDVTVGTAAGALSGLVFGAIAGGSVGKGAAIGTAIGAGGGLIKSVVDKGKDVDIPANAEIEIMLTQPITVSTPAYQFEN